ncbi:putative adipose-regulatory protein-domain-containing protein [Xylaria palmicola]|nr:putative adipose-regulatory protein-domain-containing protein [Xylaria palmicola]
MEYAKAPYRVATSSAAKRTYIGTVLFVSASLVLLGIAALAYPVFYYNYVPKKLITLPIHLQYNAGPNPYGIVSLSPDLILEQAYDISIDLTLPRSPANLDRGNFMVALYALKSVPANPALAFAGSGSPYEHMTPGDVVFASRRPALLPYADPLVARASRVLFLLYHVLWPRASETVTLSVPMGELVEFRGLLPLSVLVDVQAGQMLQVYASSVTLVARLAGMRWFMYNHPILSFAVCTGTFWAAELLAMGLAWVVLGWGLLSRGAKTGPTIPEDAAVSGMYEKMRRGGAGRSVQDPEVKAEEDVEIKNESPEPGSEPELLSTYRHGGDADDEAGSDDELADTGFGTSFHDGTEGGRVRRRASRGRSA